MKDKYDFILQHCIDKRVIDIGGADYNHYFSYGKGDWWLHGRISKVAKYVIGVENNNYWVCKLKKEGYNFYYADAEHIGNYITPHQFDIIVLGDVLEHLSRPGSFLESVKKIIPKSLIITTPNQFYFYFIIKALFNKGWEETATDHVAVYSKQTLIQLLERHGYNIVEFEWLSTIQGNCFERLVKRIMFNIFPQLSAKIGIVCTLNTIS